jgi:hypothetical protein
MQGSPLLDLAALMSPLRGHGAPREHSDWGNGDLLREPAIAQQLSGCA